MEATMETSNLVLPQGFVPMDRDEMMYVDGGATITNSACCAIIGTLMGSAILGAGAMIGFQISAAAIGTKLYIGLNSVLASVGPVGWAIMGVIGAVAIANKQNIAELCLNIVHCAFYGGSVKFGMKWGVALWSERIR